ncbi:GAF and ANTAR domain-containing protein [Cryobacterium sp. CG_9.6]|uniref:GAF and ANTAR domain-containing protein n=1 Tax=Cryobacterium sp. CG_9.6 TaxID=2760710 RepID=UPI002473C37E|nr:GAF and ANTAR domain-containing protein [Cryobacterium sp. CG_9.6]MDH6237685.1 hypothetical protein [Cryobacterium sp. CG_9.6]
MKALPISGAGVSVFGTALPETSICSSNSRAAELEELQFDLGEGPRWEAVRTRRPVFVPSLRSHPHTLWPVYGKAIMLLDVQALFVFPLIIGAIDVGVVELHSTEPSMLSAKDITTATALVDQAAWSLLNVVLTWNEQDQKTPQALSPVGRREIHQATGMVLVQLGSTATEALLRLRAHAFLHGMSVRNVAQEVVARTLVFAQD